MSSFNSISVFSKIPNLLNELRFILPKVQFYEVLSEKDVKLKDSEIIIGDFNLLAPVLYNLPKTKWLQGTWAGVDKIIHAIDKDKPQPFLITRFSGKHFGRIMAEYVLSNIVNHERDYIKICDNQRATTWSQEGKIGNYRVISDLNIGIMGLGQIGSWIGEILGKFGATVIGYGRKPVADEDVNDIIKKYYTKPNLSEFLKRSDYVVNVLPNTDETKGLLDGDVLKNCKDRGAVFINVGRGSIISENDLVEALDKQWISAAILDVFNNEPLPECSRLWSMRQVKITPHVSAVSNARHIAEQFKENYGLYNDMQPIPATLNVSKGY